MLGLPAIIAVTAFCSWAVGASPVTQRAEAPLATVRNGTYQGRHLTEYNQDVFLSIPFAQPPVGGLRFRNPQPLNESWYGTRDASNYGPFCVGYGTSQIGYNISEDCLQLNIIRPAGEFTEPLPVLVWIYGGAWVQGGAPDRRQNMSYIVQRSVDIGQPIIAVNLNYRLSAWGFLSSDEVKAAGDTNVAIRDQRLALHWIQENIGAFGGDKSKVTIWGQSAGGASVGIQVLAYDGRDDGLFRQAIMDSGGPGNFGLMSQSLQPSYDLLVNNTGCSTASDSLQCLRDLDFETLNAAINTTALARAWAPRIDGDIIARRFSQQLAEGKFAKVPAIIGANSDEGTFYGPNGINTTEQFRTALVNNPVPVKLPEDFADQILAAYPENATSTETALANLGGSDWQAPAYPYGRQYRRTVTYYGDQGFIAQRRSGCEAWSRNGLSAYCYRFNAIPAWAGPFDGSAHFSEVAFAMLNIEGEGYLPVRTPPFQGKGEEYKDLARLMSSDYIAFTVTGDPNAWAGRSAAAPTLGGEIPAWPKYENAAQGGDCSPPRIFLFNANVTSSVEDDIWRKDGIALINSRNADVYDR